MAEQLIVIHGGMQPEEGVRWIGADMMHDTILRLLDRKLAGLIEDHLIDELSDQIMELIFTVPKAVEP